MPRRPPKEPEVAVVPMRPWRVRLVYAVVAVLVLGHLMEIARQTEHWPFSNYPMWARLASGWEDTQVVAMGVTNDDPPEEVKLTDPSYFAPMPLYYQRLNFNRAAGRASVRDNMLRDYLAAYEQRRAAGLHQGPVLKAIRLYRLNWKMDRRASNAAMPDRRELVYEYPAPRSGGGT